MTTQGWLERSVALLGVGGCVTGGGPDWNVHPYLDSVNAPMVQPGATSVVRFFTHAPVGALPGSSFTVDVVLHTTRGGVPGTIVKSVVIPVPIAYQCVCFPEEPLVGGPWSLRTATIVSDDRMGEICA